MKILIVDDSATIRKFLKSMLEPRNFQITEAVSAEEAISLFEQNSYDLITLDIEMAGSNGYEACRKIREIEKERNIKSKSITPILFITSNDTMQGRIKGFEAGTTDFITKPFTKEFLLETVQNILYPKNLLEGINVLLVEDSLPIRDIIKRIISEQGCTVIEADNGKIALDIIEKDPTKIDLVLTDYYMPVMNGDELCIHVKKKLGLINLPFIFITAVADSESILKIFKSGGSDYFIKPFVKEKLIAKLKVHIQNLLLIRANEKQMQELKILNNTKDKFFNIIAHDLRNPFSGILTLTDVIESKLLKDKKEEIPELLQCNQIIKTAAKSAYGLLENLMQWAKSQTGELNVYCSNISIKEIIVEAISVINGNAFLKNITIENNAIENDLVYADEQLVKTILRNLLTNAVKFTHHSGKIIVTASKRDDFLEISIQDTGIGIEPENIGKIFRIDSKFSKPGTDKEKGTGLGLILCKEFVEKLGGSIWVKSEIKKGSTFTFALPLVNDY